MEGYIWDAESNCLSDAISELRQGRTAYIYNPRILDKLKQKFKDLNVTKREFYWSVKSEEATKEAPRRGRPKRRIA